MSFNTNICSLIIFSSTRIFSLLPLLSIFNKKQQIFLPSISFSAKLKYNPLISTIDKEKNFFLNSIECKKFLLYLCNQSNFQYGFNFYRTKKIQTKFRKRKNIFFNVNYNLNLNKQKNFFFNLPNFLFFFKKNSSHLYLDYDFYTNILKLKETKNKIKISFLNIHFFLSYINDLKFTKKNYIFDLNLSFAINFFSQCAKNALFYYLLKLNEEVKI